MNGVEPVLWVFGLSSQVAPNYDLGTGFDHPVR
jgi:hypothetical protein